MTDADRYAEKITKLLALAENTKNEAEAEAFLAKAQALMVTYAIDEAMLAKARGAAAPDQIGTKVFTFTGGFRKQLAIQLAYPLLLGFGCKAYYTEGLQRDENGNRVTKGGKHVRSISLHATGWDSDLRNAELLLTSLQVQLATAYRAWLRDEPYPAWMSQSQRVSAQKDWHRGFASGANEKLRRARSEGEAVAVANATERGDANAADAVALVVKDRKQQVNDYFNEKHGHFTRRSRIGSYSTSSYDAHSAGRASGRAANIGQPGVGGSSKALGR